jgi:hypothetical protein
VQQQQQQLYNFLSPQFAHHVSFCFVVRQSMRRRAARDNGKQGTLSFNDSGIIVIIVVEFRHPK